MWYEILPTFLIMTAGLAGGGLVTCGTKYFWNGTIEGRARNSKLLRHYWNRDERLTGRARKVTAGLEGLPEK